MGIIKGTAYWASVHKDYPNTKFEPAWTINVGNLDDEAKAQLKKDGLEGKIKNRGDDQGDFIQIKQKTHNKDGSKEFQPPKVIGRMKQPFEEAIGNGSKVAVKYVADDYEGFGGGRTCYLKAVQVIEHVPYVGSGDGEDEEDFDVVGGEDITFEDLDELPLTADDDK